MRKAFTLIELLVVIAIIATLAAILFPVFARAKAAAKTSTTISNLRQLGTASLLYAADADDHLPSSTEGFEGEAVANGWTYYRIFGGQEAGEFEPQRGTLMPYTKSTDIFRSPMDADAPKSRNSFAFNGCLIVTPFKFGINPSISTTAAPDPAGQMLFGEEGLGEGFRRGTNDGFFNPAFDHFSQWHSGGSAVVFVDGHAKVLNPTGRERQLLGGQPQPCWTP